MEQSPIANRPKGTLVTMVGHASVVISDGDISLLCDPWFGGDIFNNSWRLTTSPAVTDDLLAKITHIWVSHEHPDHLHFPSLKRIPAERRRHIVLLFQRRWSREIADVLRTLGFKAVVELPLGKAVALKRGFSVTCYGNRRIDSFLAVHVMGTTILNLNDCKIGKNYLSQVRHAIGPVDLLLSQFSFAGWIANKGSTPAERNSVLERTARYAQEFAASSVWLFASHVNFCHEENDYMNEWSVGPKEAVEWVRRHVQQSVNVDCPYPGDTWTANNGFAVSPGGTARYERDRAEINATPRRASTPVQMEELLTAGTSFAARVRNAFPLRSRRLPPVVFHVSDLDRKVEFDIRTGEVREARAIQRSAMAVTSDALKFCFDNRWGFDTLEISGRVLVDPSSPKSPPAFKACFDFSAGLSGQNRLRAIAKGWYFADLWRRRGEVADTLIKATRQLWR